MRQKQNQIGPSNLFHSAIKQAYDLALLNTNGESPEIKKVLEHLQSATVWYHAYESSLGYFGDFYERLKGKI